MNGFFSGAAGEKARENASRWDERLSLSGAAGEKAREAADDLLIDCVNVMRE